MKRVGPNGFPTREDFHCTKKVIMTDEQAMAGLDDRKRISVRIEVELSDIVSETRYLSVLVRSKGLDKARAFVETILCFEGPSINPRMFSTAIFDDSTSLLCITDIFWKR